jgi:Cu/Ag efflux protein CusF
MEKPAMFGLALVIAWTLCAVNLYAEPAKKEKSEASQSKVGEVKSVGVEGKKIVVMVAREMTFSVTDKTKIQRRDAAAKLADIKVGAKVKVEYTRKGDDRTAVSIAILGDEGRK